ncbi:MAG: V-type ATPase subunit [Syntrophobacteraceae bacterium]
MRNYADEANLHVRIYAMRGRLLSRGDYARRVREQAPEFLGISGEQEPTSFKRAVFREQIAPVIPLVEAYERYTPLFVAFLRQYEARNAKLLLARAFGKQSLALWYDIFPFAVLHDDLLEKKLSPDDLRALLAHTYLAHDLKDISNYRQTAIHLEVSAALNLYRAATSLSARGQKEFQDILLQRIAVLTAIWSLRLREHYQWSEEKIRLYREEFHDLFGLHASSGMSREQRSLNDSIERLRKLGGERPPSLADIEHYLERKYYARVSAMFHRDFHSLYCVVAYLWLLFYQVKNLFCIIDAKRFGLSAERVLDRIICDA